MPLTVKDIVRAGETISSSDLERRAGGKGANQAVAVAKAGGAAELVGAVGDDGRWVLQQLQDFGVDVRGVSVAQESTGRAVIQLAKNGENSIILYKGANYASLPIPSMIHSNSGPVSFLLLQNEIPYTSTLAYLSLAHSQRITTIFNPSPMPSPDQLRNFPWKEISWLIINEGEAVELLKALGASHVTPFDASNPDETVQDNDDFSTFPKPPSLLTSYTILARLSRHPFFSPSVNIICTLGAVGVLAVLPSLPRPVFVPAARVEGQVTDTTGAGDCFTGYLVAGLMELPAEAELDEEKVVAILRICVQAAGICVERRGAMESIPTREEVYNRLR